MRSRLIRDIAKLDRRATEARRLLEADEPQRLRMMRFEGAYGEATKWIRSRSNLERRVRSLEQKLAKARRDLAEEEAKCSTES